MEKKVEDTRVYERPSVRRVRLDIKTSVLGINCQMSPDFIIGPDCETPGTCYGQP